MFSHGTLSSGSTARFLRRVGHYLSQIQNLDLFAESLTANGIIEHDQAVWTRCHNDVSASLIDGLRQPPLIDAGIRIGFHPHLAPTTAAAKTLGPVAFHLDPVHPRERVKYRPRGLVDVVIAAKVAGIMVREAVSIHRLSWG
jgi:hypothetical protein